ncbi:uncharacterized protein [Ptychodera flava]|uniref:uncharacterized protein n=1 Tax=Ptychodera flava TaxID=63121 RepID=UPI003969CE51
MVSDRNEAGLNFATGRDGKSLGPSQAAKSKMFRTEMHMTVGEGKVIPTKYITTLKSCMSSVRLSLPVKMKTELFERIALPDSHNVNVSCSPMKRSYSDSWNVVRTHTKNTKFPKLKNNIFLIRDKLSREHNANQRNFNHGNQDNVDVVFNNNYNDQQDDNDDKNNVQNLEEPIEESRAENTVESIDNANRNGTSNQNESSPKSYDSNREQDENTYEVQGESSRRDLYSGRDEIDGRAQHTESCIQLSSRTVTVSPSGADLRGRIASCTAVSEHDVITSSDGRDNTASSFGFLCKSKSKSEILLPTAAASSSSVRVKEYVQYCSTWNRPMLLGDCDPFVFLPDHVLAKIFHYLPTRDLAVLKCTCKDFKWIIEEYNVCGIDSKWTTHPRYQDDPCMQCGKLIDPRGDVSLCRWHPKIFYKNGHFGRFWTCCFKQEENAPGCTVSLHDNNWMLRKEKLKRIPRRSQRKSMPKRDVDYERELFSD